MRYEDRVASCGSPADEANAAVFLPLSCRFRSKPFTGLHVSSAWPGFLCHPRDFGAVDQHDCYGCPLPIRAAMGVSGPGRYLVVGILGWPSMDDAAEYIGYQVSIDDSRCQTIR